MQLLNRLMFFLKARTRHGTHSPFIYAFLDRTLYAKKHSRNPGERLLLAAFEHFKPKSVGTFTASFELDTDSGIKAASGKGATPGNESATQQGANTGKDLARAETNPPYDLGIVKTPGPGLQSWLEDEALWHSDSLIYVGGIRKDRKSYGFWEQAIQAKGIRLRLETYHAGLLFFRPEQAPEHFKIRL